MLRHWIYIFCFVLAACKSSSARDRPSDQEETSAARTMEPREYRAELEQAASENGNSNAKIYDGYPIEARTALTVESMELVTQDIKNFKALKVQVSGKGPYQFARTTICPEDKTKQDQCVTEEYVGGGKLFHRLAQGKFVVKSWVCVEPINAEVESENCSMEPAVDFYSQEENKNEEVAVVLDQAADLDRQLTILCEEAQRLTTDHQNWPPKKGKVCSNDIKITMENFRKSGGHMCTAIADLGLLDEIGTSASEEVGSPPEKKWAKALMIAGGTLVGLFLVYHLVVKQAAKVYGRSLEVKITEAIRATGKITELNNALKKTSEFMRKQPFFSTEFHRKFKGAYEFESFRNAALSEAPTDAARYKNTRTFLSAGKWVTGIAALLGAAGLIIGFTNWSDNHYSELAEGTGPKTCDESYRLALNEIGAKLDGVAKESRKLKEKLITQVDSVDQ